MTAPRMGNYRDADRSGLTSTLLTKLIVSHGGSSCRVCGGRIIAGCSIRFREWGVDVAHDACGWFRPDEQGVIETRRPGSSFSFFEWRCPSCGLDSASVRRPDAESELRCERCEPDQHRIVLGSRVELIVPSFVTVQPPKAKPWIKPRRRVLPRGTRARVVVFTTGASSIVVDWIGVQLPKTSIPTDSVVRV